MKSEISRLAKLSMKNPDGFKAYSIEEGYLKSIMDDETHLISDNYLDSVSERIGGEFDELLRIGYVKA